MFCPECGAAADRKFCPACGFRLPAMAPTMVVETATGTQNQDWSDCLEYETLVRIPEVRDRIARAAAQAKKTMSAEDFLDKYSGAASKLAGLPVSLPMTSIAQFAQTTYAKMGVRTGKSRTEFVTQPAGQVIVSLLCSLARHGRSLREVHQLTDGCVLVAALPSDLFAMEGELIITVARTSRGTQVEARTEIKGQIFDWGKSTRCLDVLFAELVSPAAA